MIYKLPLIIRCLLLCFLEFKCDHSSVSVPDLLVLTGRGQASVLRREIPRALRSGANSLHSARFAFDCPVSLLLYSVLNSTSRLFQWLQQGHPSSIATLISLPTGLVSQWDFRVTGRHVDMARTEISPSTSGKHGSNKLFCLNILPQGFLKV